jgi:DNA polymerase sigma
VSPTATEQAARATAASDVKRLLKSLFPSCQVAIFGSELTGLCLPSSDLDMACLGVNLSDPRGKPLLLVFVYIFHFVFRYCLNEKVFHQCVSPSGDVSGQCVSV